MGSWPVPWGIELKVDLLNALVLTVVAVTAAVVTLGARASVEREIPGDRLHLFWAVWLLCITGFLGITVTGDAFNLYVLLEIASLTTYTLIAMGPSRRALTATINYVVLGTVGASFILLGIGHLYMVTGTLNMHDMAQELSRLQARWALGEPAYRSTVVAAFGFLLVGTALKLALFPLHGWLPAAYTHAPSAVSALLAGTATKVGAYMAIRFLFTVLGARFSFTVLPTGYVLLVLSSMAILFGSYVAFRQHELKRMMAYSSVAQIGYIAAGVGLANPEGLAGALVHVLGHAFTKAGLFLALACVAYRCGGTTIAQVRGLSRRMPLTAAALVAGGLSLVGMPLTTGVVSKWYLVSGALAAGHPEVAVVVLAGSLLALMYTWRIMEAAYFAPGPPPDGTGDAPAEAPASLLCSVWLLLAGTIAFGVHSRPVSAIALDAAGALLEAWPGGGA